MTRTVGRLARRFGLSRTALLYYHRIGLLEARDRSASNYRLYSEEDVRRLEEICRYRAAGLRLGEIRAILDAPGGRTSAILEARLDALNEEIARLREQQRVIVRLLRCRSKLRRARAMDKTGWVALLRASGLSDEDMHRWHVEFERRAPRAHQDFLESLGIAPREVAAIRRRSRTPRRKEA